MLIATRQILRELMLVGCFNPQPFNHKGCIFCLLRRIQKSSFFLILPESGKTNVCADRHLEDNSLLLAILRNEGDSRLNGIEWTA